MHTVSDRSPQVLFVDDDQLVRDTFCLFFSAEGWTFDAVADGRAALTALAAREYDLVITDLMMPEISGQQLIAQLRQQRPHQLVMVVTGAGSEEDERQLYRQGVAEVLHKPVDFSHLRSIVQTWMRVVRRSAAEAIQTRFAVCESGEYEFRTDEIANQEIEWSILNRLVEAKVIAPAVRLQLVLAYQEALTNAIEHGNLELPSAWKEEFDADHNDRFGKARRERLAIEPYASRKLWFRHRYTPQEIVLEIRDQGPGFTPAVPPREPRVDDEPLCHGRGMAIIKGSVDEVVYAEGGRHITLRKRLV